tara:strand:- start:7466 stop:7666 length:201 start_codon:yes stop_codon:yes gene_type:complete
MTKKHFKLLAQGYRELCNNKQIDKHGHEVVKANNLFNMLVDFCKSQNMNFDYDRFYNACNGLPYKK